MMKYILIRFEKGALSHVVNKMRHPSIFLVCKLILFPLYFNRTYCGFIELTVIS